MSTAQAIRPIRSREDLDSALARIDEIFDAPAGSPEGNEAEVLATLIVSYEREHFPVGPSDPVESLKFHMERLGLRQVDLIPYFGSAPRVSEVLRGKRAISVEAIRKLHFSLGIPVEGLLGGPLTPEEAKVLIPLSKSARQSEG